MSRFTHFLRKILAPKQRSRKSFDKSHVWNKVVWHRTFISSTKIDEALKHSLLINLNWVIKGILNANLRIYLWKIWKVHFVTTRDFHFCNSIFAAIMYCKKQQNTQGNNVHGQLTYFRGILLILRGGDAIATSQVVKKRTLRSANKSQFSFVLLTSWNKN